MKFPATTTTVGFRAAVSPMRGVTLYVGVADTIYFDVRSAFVFRDIDDAAAGALRAAALKKDIAFLLIEIFDEDGTVVAAMKTGSTGSPMEDLRKSAGRRIPPHRRYMDADEDPQEEALRHLS